MQTVTRLEPIVNGRFNFEMTNEQLFTLPYETKKQCAWNIIVALEFAHSFRNIAYEIFTAVPCKYTYDMITIETVDDIFTEVRNQFETRHRQLLILTSNFYYSQGQQIHKAQKELGFNGFLEMDNRKLVGYLQAIGSWNNFEHSNVCDAIKKLEREVPKFYILNNPNNGMSKHIWTVTSEYITMKFDYLLSKASKDQYLDFYKNIFEPTAISIKANSVRCELQELGNDAISLEFIMWWD